MTTETLYGLRMDREDIDEEQFTDSELSMLDVLEEGRGTPAYLAEKVGVTQEYARERLRELVRLGIVRKVHRGLYELNDDED